MLAKDIELAHIAGIFSIYGSIAGEVPSYVKPHHVYERLRDALKNPREAWWLEEGWRVGSHWSGHSKLKFRIKNDGSFTASFFPNMDYDNPDRDEASKAAEKFRAEVTKYLSQVDSTK